MTDAKVQLVFAEYHAKIKSQYPPATAARCDTTKRWYELGTFQQASHLLWMCEEAQNFINQGRKEKAMRWLGFVQGVFCVQNLFSIEELGRHSMPDPEDPEEPIAAQ